MASLSSVTRATIESRLDELELLMAMYPGELLVDQSTEKVISALRDYRQSDDASQLILNHKVAVQLNLLIEVEEKSPCSVSLFIELDPRDEGTSSLKLRVRQPQWLSKAEVNELTRDLPDDIFSAIEHVQECANSLVHTKSKVSQQEISPLHDPLVRVWFYFPSISTREKRDDIVRFAPSHKLTGFLLAGKPGILCLEGGARGIDEYMKFIKSVSWSDIPSQHKKVSEKFRESGDSIARVFSDMSEITDMLEKRGERSNRGDMKALEAWLASKGLSDAFTRVLL